jgi:hypothetical protein
MLFLHGLSNRLIFWKSNGQNINRIISHRHHHHYLHKQDEKLAAS